MPTFPDEHNKDRAAHQTIAKDHIQLDHMVPQDTLKPFADTLVRLKSLTENGSSLWINCKTKLAKLMESFERFAEQPQPLGSAGWLINVPENIVPGYKPQIQGADNKYDPQVAMNNATCSETAISLTQRQMYMLVKELNDMIDQGVLPNSAESAKDAFYDEDLDEWLAAKIAQLTAYFDELVAINEPYYDANVWYAYNHSYVKKRPAVWLNANAAPAQVAADFAIGHPEWVRPALFTFQLYSLARTNKGKPFKVPVTVTVNLTVPVATWQHIYERHVLNRFKGDVQAVNTFWQNDPYVFLTGVAGINLLTTELTYLLKDSFNFSKPLKELIDEEEDEANWSCGAMKLFFQGDAESRLTANTEAGITYTVDITLKSIAPQSEELGNAFLPQDLPRANPLNVQHPVMHN